MKTKKGMASLYLVAFTTLLLGIVTMSFARVMISESREASNSDLSQSAFDSALAGIEDAKTAIIMYEACQNSGPDAVLGNNIKCDDVIRRMTDGFNTGNCDVVRRILENSDTAAGRVDVSPSLNQYYNCVTIANDAPTYRSTLNEDTRSRVIPARIENNQYGDVVGIELEWFSDVDPNDTIKYMFTDTDKSTLDFIPLKNKGEAMDTIDEKAAPILTFELFQTDNNFTMAELDLNNEDNTGTDHAMIMLYPDKSKDGDTADVQVQDSVGNQITVAPGTFVSARNLLDASNKSNQAALNASANYNDSIVPKMVTCGFSSGARCRATIEFPATYQNNTTVYQQGTRAKQTFIFRVSLPYGTPETDFSIKPCTRIANGACTDYVKFSGAQYIVDSTGEASTLYRRIIARIETAPKFIFPEYAVQVSGNNSTIEKNFWVTENCWSLDGKGNSSTCANNGDGS